MKCWNNNKTVNQVIRDAKKITIQTTESPIGLIHVSKAQLTKLVKEVIELNTAAHDELNRRTIRVAQSKHYPEDYWLQQLDDEALNGKYASGEWEDIGDHCVFTTDDYDNIYIA